jgi:tetratricopeptide (TPR) repeat protein
MQDFDGAIDKYRKAVKIEPNYGEAYANWGNALIQKHDWDGAIAQYQKGVTVNSGNAEFRKVLGALQRARQEEQKRP